MPPVPPLWKARRECYLVGWPDDDGDAMSFAPVAMADLAPGDYFTLEASHPIDPIHGTVAVERMWRATDYPFTLDDGEWAVECERV